MTSKTRIILGLLTIGLVPLAWWSYRKARHIDMGWVSTEWCACAEYNKEGFQL